MANEEAKEAATKPSDRIAFLAEARKRFKRCNDATTDNRVFQLDDIKFAAGSPDNGWQWPEDVLAKRMKDPNGARPTLTVNKLPQHIKLVTNEQRKNKPAGKILPVDDKGDPEVAEVLNGIIRHIEVASHADVAYDTACENQVTLGEGYWRILTDYCDEMSFEQDIRIAAIKNSFAVYMDPDALRKDSTGRLCEYAFITDKLPTAEYERMFPKAKSKTDWDDLGYGDDTFDWFDDEGVMIAEYFYVEHKKEKLVLWSDGSVTVGDEMPKVAGLLPVNERQTQLRKVKWCKINGIEVLEERDWAGKYIPVVRVVGNEWDVEGQMVVSGIVRNAKDPQRMVNYWTSQEAEMLALAPKAPFVGAVGQFENQEDRWRDANTVNFAYLEYNPIDVNGTALPPPARVVPPLPPAGIINAKLGSADDLQSTVGQYNPSLGAEAKEKSGKAIQARQQQADVGTFHYIDNLSRSIGYSTEIVLDLIPKIYDTERVARIIGEDGEPDQCRMCVGQGVAVKEIPGEDGAIEKIYDPSVGKYDVVVTVGPSYTTKRIEAVDSMMALTQANPDLWKIIGDLLVKNMDWNGADEMAKRLKKAMPPELVADEDADEKDPEQMMAQVQQAAQQLGQKEAQISAAQEQVAMAAEEAQKQEELAKAATAKAQAKVDEINAASIKLEADKQVLAAERREAQMAKQLAEAQIAKSLAEASAKMTQEAAGREREVMEKREEELTYKGQLPPEVLGALLESQQKMVEAVTTLVEVTTAERETELTFDEAGEPMGSRSRVILPESRTVN